MDIQRSRQWLCAALPIFAVDFEHTVDALLKIWTATMQTLLQHSSHVPRPLHQRIHFGQFALCQALPARRERHLSVQFMEQRLHFSHAKADRLCSLNKCQSAQNICLITSLSTDALWPGQKPYTLIIPNSRSANARLSGYLANAKFSHRLQSFFLLTSSSLQ